MRKINRDRLKFDENFVQTKQLYNDGLEIKKQHE